jgi:choline-sulfatase
MTLAALCTCSREQPPDLVLISLDTVRADVFAEMAREHPVLRPLLDAGVNFRAAATPTPLTLPAHVSIMSALDPNRHGVRNNGQHMAADIPVLAERLQAAGYATGAVVSAFPLDRQFGLARGFDAYDQPQAGTSQASEFATLERNAETSIAAATDWLAAHPQRAFLWLHLFDAHAPYLAPGSDPAAAPEQRYRAEIDYMGRELGSLLQALKQRGRPYVVVLVGDHGEGLGQHNELDHGLLLYDSTVLVPMLWYAPGRFTATRIDQVSRLIDVTPTLIELAGAEPIADADGVSLLPLLSGRPQQLPAAYAETYYPSFAYRRQPLRSVREGEWKSIGTDDTTELYDLAKDPQEQNDLASAEVERAAAAQLRAWQRPEPAVAEAAGSAEVSRQLQGLGYVSAGESTREVKGHPREVVPSHRRLVELQNLLGTGAQEAALAAAQALVHDEPENAFAAYVLGVLQLDRGDRAAALQTLQSAVQLDPENPQSRFKLAEVLMRNGRHLDALPHWQALELLDPGRVAVWTNEAAALAALGNWQEARIAIQRALLLAPEDLTAIDNAAAIAERLGDWADAAQWLSRQAQLQGAAFDQFGRLSLLLARANQLDQALLVAAKVPQTRPDYALALLARALASQRQGNGAAATAALRQLQSTNARLYALALRQFPELANAGPN